MTYEFSQEIGSPGLGVSPLKLSAEPLATEAEATTGPDDEVNADEIVNADMGVADVPGVDTMDFSEEDFGFEPLDFDEDGFSFEPPRF